MSKVAFVADVHIGNHKVFGGHEHLGMNQRCWLTLHTLEEAAAATSAFGCETLVVAGDLFDSITPTPQMIDHTRDALVHASETVLLLGNHDARSAEERDNALSPLRDGLKVSVVDFNKSSAYWHRSVGAMVYYIPFKPGKADVWFVEAVKKIHNTHFKDEKNITVVTHLGLREGTEAPWLLKSHDSIDFRLAIDRLQQEGIDIKHLVAGNWHLHKKWVYKGVNVVQIGALAPTGFDNPGHEGYGVLAMLELESGVWSYEEIPGPRFIKWNGKVPASQHSLLKKMREVGQSVYLRWVVPQEFHTQASEIAHSLGVSYEISIDGAESKAAARSAGMSAKSSKTLDSSLAGYVNNMHLEEGVDRGNVLQQCRDYLAKHR